MTATAETAGRTISKNLEVLGEIDGLTLTGDVVACYIRDRQRKDGSGGFQMVELHLATAAAVRQVDMWDEKLLHELTGFTVREVSGQRITIPVRPDVFNGSITWKARRPVEQSQD